MALKESSKLTDESVAIISSFQSGLLKPIPTGIDHLDEMLLGGLLPGTVLGIVARSSHGKSYDAERIQRHIISTQGEDIIYINANWELSHFKILVRDICQITGRSMKDILFNSPNTEELEELKKICSTHRTDNVFYQNEPVTPEIFAEDVEEIIKKFPNKRIVVSIDNLENILTNKGDQKSSMDALLSQVNRLKNQHFFISFIILNQMNNNFTLRMDDLKKQRPLESDVYGSDQLIKLCDVLYIKMLPFRIGIRDHFMVFGKDSYPWLEDFKLYNDNGKLAHFEPLGCAYYFYLKRRNADPKDIKDLFVERMFRIGDMEITPVTNGKIEHKNKVIPNFKDKIEIEILTTPTLKSLSEAFGEPEIEESDSDAPF
jgi:KaiC/GvpD/RAD55 family RecA-like ATPase